MDHINGVRLSKVAGKPSSQTKPLLLVAALSTPRLSTQPEDPILTYCCTPCGNSRPDALMCAPPEGIARGTLG